MTFDSSYVMRFVRGTLLHQCLGQPFAAPSHASHRSPIGKFGHDPLQHERFSENVKRRLGSRLDVKTLAN